MRLRFLVIVALVALGAGAVGYAVILPGSAGATGWLTAAATKTTISDDVVGTGSIEAATTYTLRFGSAAEASSGSANTTTSSSTTSSGTWDVDDVAVKVGDSVTAGKVVATADSSDLSVQLAIAKANLAVANATLATDKGGATADVIAAAQQAIQSAELAYASSTSSRTNTAAQNALKLEQAEAAVTKAEADLATAEAGPTSDEIATAQDALDQATMALTTAQANLTFTQQQNQLSVAAAQQALADAQAKLVADQNPGSDALGSPKPIDEVAVAADRTAVSNAQKSLDTTTLNGQHSLDQAQQQVASAELSLAAAQRTYATKSTPSSDDVTAARSALQSARDSLAALKLQIDQAETSSAQQIAQAKLSLSSARTSYSTKTAPASATQIATDKAAVASAKLAVAEAQAALKWTKLTSPVDGLVVEVNITPGAATTGSTAAIVIQSAALEASVSFGESDVPALTVGQAATVTVSATGETLDGTVTSIAPVAESSGTSSVVSYAVVVGIDGDTGSTRAGMTAQVSVTTESAADVIAVPTIALGGTAGNYSVRVLGSDGTVETRSVEVGLVTTSMAEITSGVSEGDAVITGSTSEKASSSSSTSGGANAGLGVLDGGGPPAGGPPAGVQGGQP